ncbi:DUF2334 domain-containing protein [Streptomyces sp. NPDC057638]|uniref:DUF2334 domain-containing protein n=1 Tax=Streptomyces sp. NPDC057638 TaxID=3346190 RepID=UPI0036AB0270
MIHPRTRSRPTWLALIALAIAALLGSSLLLPSTAVAGQGQDVTGRHSAHQGLNASADGVHAGDTEEWAAGQRAADAERRADQATRNAPGTPERAGKKHPRSADEAPRPRKPHTAAAPGTAKTLVLYDTAGPFGHLGEIYAMGVANLGGRFGTVTAKPVQEYAPGQIETFDATVYIGSTYYGGAVPDAIPQDFYLDILLSNKPVLWMGSNIWNMANSISLQEFEFKYGWDPTSSFYDVGGSVGNVTKVTYKGRDLTRKIPQGQDPGILRPVLRPAPGNGEVTTLATAVDTAGATPVTFPMAFRSGNLTYLGEIPFTYVSETDRIIVLQDLLFDALAPTTPEQHKGMLRLEDISPTANATQLRAIADYLKSQNIQYGINIIPVFVDPRPPARTIRLSQRPALVNTLKYMLANGAVMMSHGYTHQYGNVANPYDGVTANDFEFFRAHVDAQNYVIYDGPVTEDSAAWAQGRVDQALAELARVGLPRPKLWTTPHYAASATDYRVFGANFQGRVERPLYFGGLLSGGPVDNTRYLGQFFPYPVTDVYGSKVLPENMGSYEPAAQNNNPPRMVPDLLAAAQANLAVRDGVASFYYHPTHPVAPLKQIVDGMVAMGYTFVSPESLL